MKKISYTPNVDCLFYRGDIPCKPHKRDQKICTCDEFVPRGKRVLIIKLGATGDVIRTTPILRRIKRDDPQAEITWVTDYPEVLPEMIDKIYKLDYKTHLILQADNFDIAYNFDKEPEACSLMNLVNAKEKKGFFLKEGKAHPIDEDSYHKYWIGIDDEFCKKDTWSYPKETFHMAGWEFKGEEYIFDKPPPFSHAIPGINQDDKIIGLNTGCGARWQKRLWPDNHWIEFAKMLLSTGYKVIILGGPDENQKNQYIAEKSGAIYLGTFPFKEFFTLVNYCDAIVTAVSMAMHVAIGIKKKLILFVNVFPKEEFDLYGLGKVIQPMNCCQNYYTTTCELPCMETIEPATVYQELESLFLQDNGS